MAKKTTPSNIRQGGTPRLRFVTLWRPSVKILGGLVVGTFALIGVAAISFSRAETTNTNGLLSGQLRIMPLGDALTDGQPTYAGAYRTVLWERLVTQDHLKVDYVGSESNGDNSLPDKDHE